MGTLADFHFGFSIDALADNGVDVTSGAVQST